MAWHIAFPTAFLQARSRNASLGQKQEDSAAQVETKTAQDRFLAGGAARGGCPPGQVILAVGACNPVYTVLSSTAYLRHRRSSYARERNQTILVVLLQLL